MFDSTVTVVGSTVTVLGSTVAVLGSTVTVLDSVDSTVTQRSDPPGWVAAMPRSFLAWGELGEPKRAK